MSLGNTAGGVNFAGPVVPAEPNENRLEGDG